MIKAIDLNKTYQTQSENVKAIENANFVLPDKGLVSFLGESGSGKSTILRIIAGMDTSTSGKLFFNNIELTQLNAKELTNYRRKHVSYLFQENNLVDYLNVEENIYLSMPNYGIDKINACLDKVRLANYNKRNISELSGGQKQRIAIARSIAKDCSILICDEPTSSLDEENSRIVFEILKEISKEILVVVATHNVSLAELYSDEIIKIDNGKIFQSKKRDYEGSDTNLFTDDNNKKKIYKIARKNLKNRKSKAFLAILLCFLSSALLMCSINSFTFDAGKLGVEEYSKDNANYTSISINENLSKAEGDDLLKSIEDTSNHKFIKASTGRSSIDEIKGSKYRLEGIYYNRYFKIAEFDYDFFIQEKVTLLCGEYPNNTNDVLITKYQFDCINEFGYKESESAEKIFFSSYDEILNYHLTIYKNDFVIVGVVDTHFNDERFQQLKSIPEEERNKTPYIRSIARDAYNINSQSFHNAVFSCGFDEIIEKSGEQNGKKYFSQIAFVSSGFNKIEIQNLAGFKNIKIQHFAFAKAEDTADYFVHLRNISMILGLLLLILFVFSIINYLKLDLSENQNANNVFGSIGFASDDIEQIYQIETLIIVALSLVLSILLSISFVVGINSIFAKYFAFLTNIISFSVLFALSFSALLFLLTFVLGKMVIKRCYQKNNNKIMRSAIKNIE